MRFLLRVIIHETSPNARGKWGELRTARHNVTFRTHTRLTQAKTQEHAFQRSYLLRYWQSRIYLCTKDHCVYNTIARTQSKKTDEK
jgi:hypothetical protein